MNGSEGEGRLRPPFFYDGRMQHPGRRLPFDVYFPAPGERAPQRVSHLRPGQIVLVAGGQADTIFDTVAFDDHGPRWANPALRVALTNLNARGLPFQYQPHDPESPAALMAWWQENGQLAASYRELSWRGPGDWLITRIDLPHPGMLGWAGPRPFGH